MSPLKLHSIIVLFTLLITKINASTIIEQEILSINPGTWTPWSSSGLENNFVNGISVQFNDDDSINGVRFHHTRANVLSEYKKDYYYQVGLNATNSLKWEGPKYCERGIVNGFQLEIKHTNETVSMDNIKLHCSDKSSIETGSGSGRGNEGQQWTEIIYCENGHGVCGAQGQFGVNKGFNSTTTLVYLTNLRLDCCPVPHPASTCTPSDTRRIVAECNNPTSLTPKTCTFQKILGTTYAGKELETSIYEDLGYDLQSAGKYLKKKNEFNLTNTNHDYSEIENLVWNPETITIAKLVAQPKTIVKIEQVIGYCGFYKVYTPLLYREVVQNDGNEKHGIKIKHIDHSHGSDFYDTEGMQGDGHSFMGSDDDSWEDEEDDTWDQEEAEINKAEDNTEKLVIQDKGDEEIGSFEDDDDGQIWSSEENVKSIEVTTGRIEALQPEVEEHGSLSIEDEHQKPDQAKPTNSQFSLFEHKLSNVASSHSAKDSVEEDLLWDDEIENAENTKIISTENKGKSPQDKATKAIDSLEWDNYGNTKNVDTQNEVKSTDDNANSHMMDNPFPIPIETSLNELESSDPFTTSNIPAKIETRTKTLEAVDEDVETSHLFDKNSSTRNNKGELKNQMIQDEPENGNSALDDSFENLFSDEDDPTENPSLFNINIQDISDKASDFAGGLKKTMDEIKDTPIFQDAKKNVENSFENAKNAVKDTVENAKNTVQDTVKSALENTQDSDSAPHVDDDHKIEIDNNQPTPPTDPPISKAGGYLGYIVGGMVVCVIVIVVVIFVIEKRAESMGNNAEQSKLSRREEYLKDNNAKTDEPLLSSGGDCTTKITIENEKGN